MGKTWLWIYAFLGISLFSTMIRAHPFSPRFVSLKPNEVNLRVGPGNNYPVEWVYLKAGLPVEVTAEFDVWRRIRDCDGVEGWVHQTMLSGKRHALIHVPETLLYKKPDPESCPLARLEGRVLVDLLACKGSWCQIRVDSFKGWVHRETLWGVYPQETIE